MTYNVFGGTLTLATTCSKTIFEQHVFICETVCDVAASECSMSLICIRNCLHYNCD